jgi:hypothetical protein
MGRTEKDEYFREQFLDEIVAQGKGVEDMSTLARRYDDISIKNIFDRWSRIGREIFFLKGTGFINVHIRSEPPGFWGVRKNVLNDFKILEEKFRINCLFVLLVADDHGETLNGYILKNMSSSSLLKAPSEQEEDYKINETALDKNKKIVSLKSVVEELIKIGEKSNKKTVIRRSKEKL